MAYLGTLPERLENPSFRKWLDAVDGACDIAEGNGRLSKGKDSLALGAPADRFTEGVGRGQVNLHPDQLVQAVFDFDHVDQREA